MTDLTRKLRRVTAAKVRGVALVVDLSPFEVTIREFGSRHGYTVPWSAIYDLGGRLKAREDASESRKTRRVR